MWRIEIEGKAHKIELFTSTVSGKKRVLKDGYLVLEKKMRFGEFKHSMPINNHVVTIVEGDTDYELCVDNIPFSLLNKLSEEKKEYEGESYAQGMLNNNFKDPINFSDYNQYDNLHIISSKPDRSEQPMGYRLNTHYSESPYINATSSYLFSWSEEQDSEDANSKTSQVPGIFAQQMSKNQVKKPTPQITKPAVQVEKEVVQPIVQPVVQPKHTITQPVPQIVPIIKEEPKPLIDLLDVKEPEDALPDLFEDPNPSLIPTQFNPSIVQKKEVAAVNAEEDYLTKAFNQSAQTYNEGLVGGDFGYSGGFNVGTNTIPAEHTKYYFI